MFHKPPPHTQNADAADKSPDVIPGNGDAEQADAGPDSVSYNHKLGVFVYCLV